GAVPARHQRPADSDGARRGRVHVPVQLLRPSGRHRARRLQRRRPAGRAADRRAPPSGPARPPGGVRLPASPAMDRPLAGAVNPSSAAAPPAFMVGPVRVAPNVILAPMSGITDSAYRSVVKDLNPNAVGLVVTEFVSIEALARQNLRTHRMLRY